MWNILCNNILLQNILTSQHDDAILSKKQRGNACMASILSYQFLPHINSYSERLNILNAENRYLSNKFTTHGT